MSWPVLMALAIGTLALKAIGPLLFAARPVPPWLGETISGLPLAIFPALVASATLSPSSGTSLEERLIPAAVVLALDIVSKVLAVKLLTPGQPVPILGDTVTWTLVRNSGAAF